MPPPSVEVAPSDAPQDIEKLKKELVAILQALGGEVFDL
ncbi:hypothetical protein SPBRAN_1590 [uncultured Candidatus Thioglobus sp.]|nr:hypothetical protein SPBRAN_1590 [uncultured Candidatus Thioglobus sp.]